MHICMKNRHGHIKKPCEQSESWYGTSIAEVATYKKIKKAEVDEGTTTLKLRTHSNS